MFIHRRLLISSWKDGTVVIGLRSEAWLDPVRLLRCVTEQCFSYENRTGKTQQYLLFGKDGQHHSRTPPLS